MKRIKYLAIGTLLFACIYSSSLAQSTKTDLLLGAGYYNSNGQIQYLKGTAKTKIDRKFQPVPGLTMKFYLAEVSPAGLLGQAVTNDKGEAVLLIPASAKSQWQRSPKQSFLVTTDKSSRFDAANGSLDITKSRIGIDTADGRKIVATFYGLVDSAWVPIKGVEMKIGIRRLGADLGVSETQSYTTDSTGSVTADFKRDSLPGDTRGNLVLVARTEDNDTYGNVSMEKTVPWGAPLKYVSAFDKRTLFARRGRSPIWLELIAYGIIIVVWSVLIYLLFQIRKLVKLGGKAPYSTHDGQGIPVTS